MICIPCREKDHDNCDDNPRKLAFSKKLIKGITDVSAGEWCYCHHSDPIPVNIPVKEVIE